ncbi:isoprenylcysteine carboxyl methyltransferase [Sulfolobales archaeon HS-7]|nr:isoprenylcysteine carboxyl methyltransferase [Sulfolobales archaeon HS-7]
MDIMKALVTYSANEMHRVQNSELKAVVKKVPLYIPLMIPIFQSYFNEDVFYLVYIVVFGTDLIVTYGIRLMRRKAGVKKVEYSTFFLFIGTLFLIIFLSYLFGYYSYFTGVGELPLEFLYVGIFLMIVGEAFRMWGILTLGKYFSPVVTVYSDHRVITQGPYKLVRHPAYGGTIILLLGVTLSLRSIISLLSILIVVALYNYRANLEESLLTENLGEEYVNYKIKVRKKFIPYLF